MNRLITAKDIAKRDNMIGVGAWIRSASARQVQLKRITVAWDGRTVNGEPVQAFVNTGRVLAQCPICGRHEYVDDQEPIFYCTTCGNGGSVAARPVEFPEDWGEIKAALLKRPIVEGFGRNEIEKVLNSKPENLARDWRPGVKAEELEEENDPPVAEATSPQIAGGHGDLGGEEVSHD
jgi:ribosomal protein L37E